MKVILMDDRNGAPERVVAEGSFDSPRFNLDEQVGVLPIGRAYGKDWQARLEFSKKDIALLAEAIGFWIGGMK